MWNVSNEVQEQRPPFEETSSEDGSINQSASSVSAVGERGRRTNQGDGSNDLAKKESHRVTLLRFLVLVVLTAATVVVSLVAYSYTSAQERESFEHDFRGFSEKVIETVEFNLERQLSALHSFGTTLTSYALDHNLTWPFVVSLYLASAVPGLPPILPESECLFANRLH